MNDVERGIGSSLRVWAVLLVIGAKAWAGDIVCFEAESASSISAPVKIVKQAADPADAKILKEASGEQYIELVEGAGKPPDVGGEAAYSFEVAQAGDYVLWIRAWWMDSCGNSLTIVMDGARPFTFGEDGTYKSWHWVKGMKVALAAGRHELKVQNREDGVKVDEILLSKDPKYVPVGIEDPNVTVEPAAQTPEAGKK